MALARTLTKEALSAVAIVGENVKTRKDIYPGGRGRARNSAAKVFRLATESSLANRIGAVNPGSEVSRRGGGRAGNPVTEVVRLATEDPLAYRIIVAAGGQGTEFYGLRHIDDVAQALLQYRDLQEYRPDAIGDDDITAALNVYTACATKFELRNAFLRQGKDIRRELIIVGLENPGESPAIALKHYTSAARRGARRYLDKRRDDGNSPDRS